MYMKFAWRKRRKSENDLTFCIKILFKAPFYREAFDDQFYQYLMIISYLVVKKRL